MHIRQTTGVMAGARRAFAGEVDGIRAAIVDGLTPLDATVSAGRLETFARMAPGILVAGSLTGSATIIPPGNVHSRGDLR